MGWIFLLEPKFLAYLPVGAQTLNGVREKRFG